MKHFAEELAAKRLDKVVRDALLRASRYYIGQCGRLELAVEDFKIQLMIKDRILYQLGGSLQDDQDVQRKELESRLEMLEHESYCLKQLTRDKDEVSELSSKLTVLQKLRDSQLERFRSLKLRTAPMPHRHTSDSLVTSSLTTELQSLLHTNSTLHSTLAAQEKLLAELSLQRREHISKQISTEAAAVGSPPTINISVCEVPAEDTSNALRLSLDMTRSQRLALPSELTSPHLSSSKSVTVLQSPSKLKSGTYRPSHLRIGSEKKEVRRKHPGRARQVPQSTYR
jgi:hypothetical protein